MKLVLLLLCALIQYGSCALNCYDNSTYTMQSDTLIVKVNWGSPTMEVRALNESQGTYVKLKLLSIDISDNDSDDSKKYKTSDMDIVLDCETTYYYNSTTGETSNDTIGSETIRMTTGLPNGAHMEISLTLLNIAEQVEHFYSAKGDGTGSYSAGNGTFILRTQLTNWSKIYPDER